jgi:Putative zinc-finger
MTDPNFERSLRAAARRGRPGGVHPDASLLAAYVDRGLTGSEREEFEAHVADCAECMERLALVGSVNVPDEPELPSFEWSPRQLLSRWGWLVPVATVVVLVAVWERQPSRPGSFAPATPAAPAAENAAPPATKAPQEEANERTLAGTEEGQRKVGFAQAPAHQVAEAPKAKDAPAKPALQAGASDDKIVMRDKKELDALTPSQANKVAEKPAAAPVVAERAQAEAAASVAGRADEATGNRPQPLAIAPMRETGAQGALLKSTVEAPVVLASGQGVSIRRSGSQLERSTDGGATWTVDLAIAPAGLRAGTCPTTAVCWLGGSQGIVLVRQASGQWTRHVVADGRAAVTAIQAADALTATAGLSDGRRFQTADGGVTWVESKP